MPDVADFSSHHIEGYTAIGNKRIDCPLFTQLTPFLWMGGSPDTPYPNPPVFPPVEAILNLYKWATYDLPESVSPEDYRVETVYDSTDQDLKDAWQYAAWAYGRVKRGVPTLIHCQAGLNRSGLITGMVLMLMGWTADEAITEMRTMRSDAVLVNPHFESFLRDIDPGDV